MAWSSTGSNPCRRRFRSPAAGAPERRLSRLVTLACEAGRSAGVTPPATFCTSDPSNPGRSSPGRLHVRTVRRYPIRVPGAAPHPVVRARRSRHPRARRRRQQCHLQHRQCRAAAAAAVRRTGSAGPPLPRAAAEHFPGNAPVQRLPGQLLRLETGRGLVRGNGDLRLPAVHDHRREPARIDRRGRRRGRFLRGRACPARPRAGVSRRRGQPGSITRGNPEPRLLAESFRQRPERGRQHVDAERGRLHHRRGDARPLLDLLVGHCGPAVVDPARVHRRGARRPRQSQRQRGRAAAARRRRGQGRLRDDGHFHPART